MGKYTDNPDRFMDEAEKMARIAAKERGLAVWRGDFSGFLYPYEQIVHCVVVGVAGDEDGPVKPLTALAFSQRGSDGCMQFENDDHFQLAPYGGGWHPLQELEKFLTNLPDFSK